MTSPTDRLPQLATHHPNHFRLRHGPFEAAQIPLDAAEMPDFFPDGHIAISDFHIAYRNIECQAKSEPAALIETALFMPWNSKIRLESAECR